VAAALRYRGRAGLLGTARRQNLPAAAKRCPCGVRSGRVN